MERTRHDYNQWMTNWPPSHAKKVLSGDDAGHYMGFGLSMLFYLKTQARLAQIQTNKIIKILPDGTQIIASICFGNDKIEIIRPELPAEPLILLPSEYIFLFLVNSDSDFQVFMLNLKTSVSLKISDPLKFWKDENYYLMPNEWVGYGGGIASAPNDFQKSRDILMINATSYPPWDEVIDQWSIFRAPNIVNFPIPVRTNVPSIMMHSSLRFVSGNCFDYPVCYSAIMPATLAVWGFHYWPYRGILPLTGHSLNAVEQVWVPTVRDLGQDSEYIEWVKKGQVWSVHPSGTPDIYITGKRNYTLVKSEKNNLYAPTFDEVILPNGNRGINLVTEGNYEPCSVQIDLGFGYDGVAWWPFWSWLHEAPTTGMINFGAMWQGVFGELQGGREARGYDAMWWALDPENPDADPVQVQGPIPGMDETVEINEGPCSLITTVTPFPGAVCTYEWGSYFNQERDGSYQGTYFFPVASLGNKRFIYFENTFAGSGFQQLDLFGGQYSDNSCAYPECENVSTCCMSLGWCFDVWPDCMGHPGCFNASGGKDERTGEATHSLGIQQTLKIGKLTVAADGKTIASKEDTVIATGNHSYYHFFHGTSLLLGDIAYEFNHPYAGRGVGEGHCGCLMDQWTTPGYETKAETEIYTRSITTFEIMDFDSNPENDDTVIAYKKIVITFSGQNVGPAAANWAFSGTRTVTWHLWVQSDGRTQVIDITPELTSTCNNGTQSASGTRAYGISLQVNRDHCAFSYLEEEFAGVSPDFYFFLTSYPGPINWEDRNPTPFSAANKENIECSWSPLKYHYGLISLGSAYPKFKKWEWTEDCGDQKVYTVGLISDERKAA